MLHDHPIGVPLPFQLLGLHDSPDGQVPSPCGAVLHVKDAVGWQPQTTGEMLTISVQVCEFPLASGGQGALELPPQTTCPVEVPVGGSTQEQSAVPPSYVCEF